MEPHLRVDLDTTMVTRELSLFFKRDEEGKLVGLVGAYVEDLRSAGTATFEEESRQTGRVFVAKSKVYSCFTFAGVTLQPVSGGMLLHQTAYANRLQLLLKDG